MVAAEGIAATCFPAKSPWPAYRAKRETRDV